MFPAQSRALRAAIALTVLAFASRVLLSQTPEDATAPTAGEDPAMIDQLWQQSNAKYDARRTAILKDVDRLIHQGPFRADWESLQKYQVPEWYRNAKFGIFIHWGVYSVPAFGNEWYPSHMYREGSAEYRHHLATYGPLDKSGYKDFIPRFKAEHFDAAAWARLFKAAGAKYVVPVAEHHDGFAMYDSGLSDWTAANMGPHRDVIGELAKAVRDEGLHFGASSHRAEHDFFYSAGRNISSDVNDPQYAGLYGPAHTWLENKGDTPLSNEFTYVSPQYADDWLARTAEIVQKYQPDILYFDWCIGLPSLRANLSRLAAFYYNASLKSSGHAGVINYKDYAMLEGSAVLDLERLQLSNIRPLHWQTDTSLSNKSWGYIENDTFKSPQFVIQQLVDVVSKNGNLLLNIAPRADGTIPEQVQQVLFAVGSWLKINGEAIYDTHPWKIYGEGPTKAATGRFRDTDVASYTAEDFRFTSKGDTVYAIELGWPSTGEAVIHSFGSKALGGQSVQSVALLGSEAKLAFRQQPDGLHIQLPIQAPGKYGYAFRVVAEGASLNTWSSQSASRGLGRTPKKPPTDSEQKCTR